MDASILDGLPVEDEAAVIAKIASDVKKRGLQVPVLLALESHKPIGPMMSQLSVAFSPFIIPFLGLENTNTYSRLLAKRESIERLILAIESDDEVESKETV